MIGLGLSLAKLSATLGGVIKKGLQMWHGFTTSNFIGSDQFVLDKSINTNNAKLLTGKALEFNGNDTVSLGSKGPTNTTAFSCAFWVKPTLASNSGDTNVLRYGRFNVWFSHNTQLHVYPNDTGDATVFTIPDATGKWQRFVLSISGLETSLYIDGILFETKSSIAISTTLRNSFIGSHDDNKYLIGLLSDLQIYDKNWTSDDVAYDYANPNNLATDNPSTSLTLSNLLAYYALSEGSGNIAFDSTGLGAELVTNGDFANGLNGFSASDEAGMLNVSDTLQITNTSTYGNVRLSHVSTVVGLSYTISVDIKAGSSSEAIIRVGTSAGGTQVFNSSVFTVSNIFETFTFSFNAPSTQSHVSLWNGSAVVGSTVFFDNISVRLNKADDGTGAFLNATPAVIGATWVDKQPTIPQLGMMDWSKSSNLIAFSDDITASNIWGTVSGPANGTGVNPVVTSNYGISPTGVKNAARVVFDIGSSTSNDFSQLQYSLTVEDEEDYNTSLYIKSNDSSSYDLALLNVAGARTNITANQSWQRYNVNGTSGSTSYNFKLRIRGNESTSKNADVLIYGPQVKLGLLGSYIATAGFAAIDATLIQNPNDIGKDVLSNDLRLRDGGFNLDGIGHAEVADDASLDVTSAVTLECWVKWNTENEKGLIAKWGGSNSVRSFLMQKVTNGVAFYLRLGSSNVQADSASFTGTGAWKHIACTHDGSTQTIYINGSVSGTPASNSGNIQATTRDVEIGRYNAEKQYGDIIDEARIYDRALSATEVLNNYKVGLSKHS